MTKEGSLPLAASATGPNADPGEADEEEGTEADGKLGTPLLPSFERGDEDRATDEAVQISRLEADEP